MALRIFPALAGALMLAGCGQSAPRTFTAGDADRLEVADVNSRNAINRVDALESRVSELEQKLASVQDTNTWLVNQNADGARQAATIAKQVSDNARVMNANSVKAMTRRGACGVRWVQNPNPGYGQPVVRSENIPCTEKDLVP